jgi:hypothetical protein
MRLDSEKSKFQNSFGINYTIFRKQVVSVKRYYENCVEIFVFLSKKYKPHYQFSENSIFISFIVKKFEIFQANIFQKVGPEGLLDFTRLQ